MPLLALLMSHCRVCFPFALEAGLVMSCACCSRNQSKVVRRLHYICRLIGTIARMRWPWVERKEGPGGHGGVPMPMRVGGQRGSIVEYGVFERRCRDLHRQLAASLIEGPAENDQSGARQPDNSSQVRLASLFSMAQRGCVALRLPSAA